MCVQCVCTIYKLPVHVHVHVYTCSGFHLVVCVRPTSLPQPVSIYLLVLHPVATYRIRHIYNFKTKQHVPSLHTLHYHSRYIHNWTVYLICTLQVALNSVTHCIQALMTSYITFQIWGGRGITLNITSSFCVALVNTNTNDWSWGNLFNSAQSRILTKMIVCYIFWGLVRFNIQYLVAMTTTRNLQCVFLLLWKQGTDTGDKQMKW